MRRGAIPRGWLGSLVLLAGVAVAVAAPAAELPIVFVPGTAGSRLVEPAPGGGPGRPLWIGPGILARGALDRAALGANGQTGLVADELLMTLRLRVSLDLVVDAPDRPGESQRFPGLVQLSQLTYPVYGSFVDWGRAECVADPARWYDVPYDWRLGAGEATSRQIDEVVERARRESGQPQVVLLAHSLGGLACRDYLCRPGNAAKVRALIAVGTPWLGAPKAARGLRWGYSFGLGGRFALPDRVDVRGVYKYVDEAGGAQRRVPYLTLVSLVDLEAARRVAETFPSVFQQLPTRELMLGLGHSVFAEGVRDEDGRDDLGRSPDATLRWYAARGRAAAARTGRDLYADAVALRQRIFDPNSPARGVRHVLIAGVTDPLISPELATDTRMALAGDPMLSWFRRERPGVLELARRLGSFFARVATGELREPGRVVDEFFEINPFFRDIGNYLQQVSRDQVVGYLQRRKDLPIYLDPYIAVEGDAAQLGDTAPRPRLGDGVAPLFSATAGAQRDTASTLDREAPARWLGAGTAVVVQSLGRDARGGFYEHSSMLDDPGVRDRIREQYRAACDAAAP